MLVYLAGPGASHNPDFASAFSAAQEKLKKQGIPAINMSLALPTEMPHEDAMDVCRVALSKCSAVLMLEGWIDSCGARAESAVAVERGIPVFYTVEGVVAWMTRNG